WEAAAIHGWIVAYDSSARVLVSSDSSHVSVVTRSNPRAPRAVMMVVLVQIGTENARQRSVLSASRSPCGARVILGRIVSYDSSSRALFVSDSSHVSLVARSNPRSPSAVAIVALVQTLAKNARQVSLLSASRSACGAPVIHGRIVSYDSSARVLVS